MATRYLNFFFRADQQIAARNNRLNARGNNVGGNVALVAAAGCCQAPQDRPIVDVENYLRAGSFGIIDRLADNRVALLGRQVCARDCEGPTGCDVIAIEVRGFNTEVGTVLAVKNMREGVAVTDAEYDQTGQSLWIGNHMTDIDALGCQCFPYKTTHVFIAYASQH